MTGEWPDWMDRIIAYRHITEPPHAERAAGEPVKEARQVTEWKDLEK